MPGAGMSQAAVTVSAMDTSVIPYAAEIEAPALKETARLVLEAEADRFGAPLDVAYVLLPRTAGCGDKRDHAE